jgi:hypothetical protein
MPGTRMSQSQLRTFITRLIGTIALATIAVGCADSPFEPIPPGTANPGPAVHQVVLGWQYRPATLSSFAIGETYKLIAAATDSTGKPVSRTINWSSSKPAVASVNSDGLVTMLADGTATITASAGGRTAAFEVRVLPPATQIGSFRMISLNGQALPAQLSAWQGGDVSGYSIATEGALVLRSDWTYSQTLAVDVFRNGAFHYDFVWPDTGQFRIENGEIVFTSLAAADRVVRGTLTDESLSVNDTVGGNAAPQLFAYERR